ncbi:unnamed protein product [Cuscuta epithymum]|uniref:Uncharacterized protein n=1 Tax=Cuscuta epithymum TaxID=186058 RepID=A0AAV0D1P6_9ASTE|nr:unnamed protein product [Cuscuta epithymum]
MDKGGDPSAKEEETKDRRTLLQIQLWTTPFRLEYSRIREWRTSDGVYGLRPPGLLTIGPGQRFTYSSRQQLYYCIVYIFIYVTRSVRPILEAQTRISLYILLIGGL